MKDEKALSQFLSVEVNLDNSRYKNASDRLSTLRKFLKENLSGFDNSEIQGSYATETIIKPVDDNDGYDIDLMVYIKDDGSGPKTVITTLEDCLSESSSYKDRLDVRKRCVKLEYAQEFSIDVVPCVERNSAKWVCNGADNTWEKTDGSGYKDWFKKQNSKSNGHLKRVVRLLKYLRDYKNTFTASSIALTTLAGMAVEDLDKDVLNTLPNALEAITEWIDTYLQQHPTPDLKNPALPEEEFNRHWTDNQYQNFRKMFSSYAGRIKAAIACQDAEKSEKQWQGIFGPKYRRSNPGGGNGNSNSNHKPPQGPSGKPPSRGAVIPTSTSPPRRFNPTPLYASPSSGLSPRGSRTAAAEDTYYDLTPLSSDNIEWLKINYPDLEYDSVQGVIEGAMVISALWDQQEHMLIANPKVDGVQSATLIQDKFKVRVGLKYRTRWVGPQVQIPHRYPPMFEAGNKARSMAAGLGVPLADLHMYPDGECCIGFKVLPLDKSNFDLCDFIEGDVVAWLYWLSYAERFGLGKARRDLWATYDHVKGPHQYLNALRKIVSRVSSDNAPCPCGNSMPYEQCHRAIVKQCKSDGLI